MYFFYRAFTGFFSNLASFFLQATYTDLIECRFDHGNSFFISISHQPLVIIHEPRYRRQLPFFCSSACMVICYPRFFDIVTIINRSLISASLCDIYQHSLIICIQYVLQLLTNNCSSSSFIKYPVVQFCYYYLIPQSTQILFHIIITFSLLARSNAFPKLLKHMSANIFSDNQIVTLICSQ